MIIDLEARLQEAEADRNDNLSIQTKLDGQLSIAEQNCGLNERRVRMLNKQPKFDTEKEKILGSYDDTKTTQVAHLRNSSRLIGFKSRVFRKSELAQQSNTRNRTLIFQLQAKKMDL